MALNLIYLVPSSLVDVRCVEFVPSLTLESPRGSAPETPGGTKGRGSRTMFWEVTPGEVIVKLVNSQCPKVMNAWKRRKHKMEKATRVPRIEHEPKSDAVERVYTERILGNLRGRQTL